MLKKIFGGKLIQLQYKQVLYKNVAQSRRLALQLIKTKIAVFMDNDISIPSNYLYKIHQCFHKQKNITAMVGPVLPMDKSLMSHYGSIFCSQGHMLEKNMLAINSYGMAAVALYMPKVKLLKLSFDPYLDTGEDMDFYLSLKEKGGILLFNPALRIRHNFKKGYLLEFLYRYYKYALNFLDIEKKNPHVYSFSHILPQRKIHWLLLPFYIMYCSYIQVEKELPNRFWPLALIVHLVITIGVYNSPRGRVLLKQNFIKSWHP